MNRLILNSKGVNTHKGALQIKNKISETGEYDLSDKTIYIVSDPVNEVDDFIIENCINLLGFTEENIYISMYRFPNYDFKPDYIYVGEGNTLSMLNYMKRLWVDDYIKRLFIQNDGITYIGSSAGAAIAGIDIMAAVHYIDGGEIWSIHDYNSLGLLTGTVLPHCDDNRLKMIKESGDEHILNRYDTIFCIDDDTAEMFEV